MPTHLWHAKRFHMGDLWGWKVPMMHSNRGPGAALRLLREGKSLLQDVTWSMQPVWLQAPLTSRQAVHRCLARIIPEFDFALAEQSMEESAASSSTGQGTLHGIDQFPMGAVGPVAWMCSRSSLTHSAANDGSLVFVYLWIHPSIRGVVLELLDQLLAEEKDGIQGPHQSVDGGVSCLRLRGNHTIESLRTTLLGFGKYDLSLLQSAVSGGDDDDDDGNMLEALRPGVTVSHAQDEEASQRLLLVSRCPRDPRLGMNVAVCTLDVFCNPDVASALFTALVLKGAACPIGVAEETHFHLECNPPVPLFPRDYPDTYEGDSYWKGNSQEWKDVREYWESGVGRFRPKNENLESIDWKQVVPTTTDDSLVVVRGGFGKPFIETLSGCGIVPYCSSCSPVHRRKRRRVRDPRHYVSAQQLSKEQAAVHLGLCTALSQNLSLPALLICHLRVLGPGTVAAGAGLYALEPLDVHLGFATAGTFSSSLGSFHGIGIVGAARLLEIIASARSSGAAIVSNRPDGGKEIQLRIRVSNGTSWCEASLSLLI
jgi:ribonuclease P/MRP protein subunit POP1